MARLFAKIERLIRFISFIIVLNVQLIRSNRVLS